MGSLEEENNQLGKGGRGGRVFPDILLEEGLILFQLINAESHVNYLLGK